MFFWQANGQRSNWTRSLTAGRYKMGREVQCGFLAGKGSVEKLQDKSNGWQIQGRYSAGFLAGKGSMEKLQEKSDG